MGQDEMLHELAERMQRMQIKAWEMAQKHDPSATLKRGFHAKGMGVRANFQIRSDLPKQLQMGLFQPGIVYAAHYAG